MKDINIKILALTMVKGIGKTAAINYLKVNNIQKQRSEDIVEQLKQFAKLNARIVVPTIEEFETFMIKSQRILEEQEEKGIIAVSYLDEAYPLKFKELKNPPVIFYAKGNLQLLEGNRHIAIIGTREVSENGASAAHKLGQLLGEKGEIIVSGLAIGCDTKGHQGCLDGKGKTIAILPSPITEVHPRCNSGLADQIVENEGLLISEYHNGQKVQRGFYVERDRLQSALSDAIVVVETGLEGGSWHAINNGIELGRVIACYNHPEKYRMLENSKGNQKLINDGIAVPLGSREEIDKFLYILKKNRNKANVTTVNEQLRIEYI